MYVNQKEGLTDFVIKTFSIKDRQYQYRPLMPTTVAACYVISGTASFCPHLIGLSLHFLNTLMVGQLAYVLSHKRRFAWLATFFFALYFAHVENIAWMSDVGNLLTVFFALSTTLLFIKFLQDKPPRFLKPTVIKLVNSDPHPNPLPVGEGVKLPPSPTGRGDGGEGDFGLTSWQWFLKPMRFGTGWHYYAFSLITFSLMMVSKESAISMPPILVTWAAIFLLTQKSAWLQKTRYILASVGYSLLLLLYFFMVNWNGVKFAFAGQGNYKLRFDVLIIRNFIYYLLNLLWPTSIEPLEKIHAIIITHTPLTQLWNISEFKWLLLGLNLITILLGWFLWQRHLIVWLGLSWLAWGILPVLFIGGYSERHLYLPSVGLSLLVSYLLMKLRPPLAAISIAVMLVANIYWVQFRVQSWQQAGQLAHHIVQTVVTTYPTMSPQAELWFVGIPDNINGAYIFRNGLNDALSLEYQFVYFNVHLLPKIDKVPQTLTADQYLFILQDGHLIDLTPIKKIKN